MKSRTPRVAVTGRAAGLLLCLFAAVGCQRAPVQPSAQPAAHTAADADEPDEKKTSGQGAPASAEPPGEKGTEQASAKGAAQEGVSLTPEQRQKVGIMTTPAATADFTPEVSGYGSILAHDGIASVVAEVATARAALAQSRAAAARTQRLAGTPGAMSADATEAATRQVATDEAALALAERHLSTTLGTEAPSEVLQGTSLEALAGGRVKLLRASFPLGALVGPVPRALRAARLDAAPGTPGWSARPVWAAAADAALPGRSLYALIKADVAEGERLLVWAPGSGAAERGVLIPSAALVLNSGKVWCYIERKPGVFVRREVNLDRPTPGGYVLTSGIAAGDALVTAAAGLLLARELNASTEADD